MSCSRSPRCRRWSSRAPTCAPGGVAARRPLMGAFLLALAGLLAARDVTTFLAFWELMTLCPAAAILAARRDDAVRARCVRLRRRSPTSAARASGWRCSCLPRTARSAIRPRSRRPAGRSDARGDRALVGFGTKAGLVPLHSWLPRAHPVAPAPPLGADVGGDDQGRALRADPGRVRVARARRRCGSGSRCWRSASLSALGGVLYALVQHDLKRLLAFHSIENVGIIALGLGASIAASRTPAARRGRRSRSPRRCCTSLNHAVFKALLFLGAGAFERAVGSLDLDRLGGLLRRMPWTGGAFLVGAMAIAGLPPLNGFASEWLTLQSLLHVALEPAVGVALAGAVCAGRARRRPRRWRCCCFVKVVGLVLLGPPRRAGGARRRVEAPPAMRAGDGRCSPGCASRSGCVPGLLVPTLAGLAPGGGGELRRHAGPRLPGTGSLPARWRWRSRSSPCRRPARARRAARGAPRPRPSVGLRPAGRPGAELDLGRLHQAAAARARGGAAPAPRDRGGRGRRASCSSVALRERGPAARSTRCSTSRRRARGAARRGVRAPAADRQRAHVRRVSARARPRACWRWRGRERSDERDRRRRCRSAGSRSRRCCPGTIQALKARLQGRRGPSPLQPYRELRRLWGKSARRPAAATGRLYRLRAARSSPRACSSRWPRAGRRALRDWGLGHDALVLVGLLALARFALAAGGWDTGSGFALMGAAPRPDARGVRRGAAGPRAARSRRCPPAAPTCVAMSAAAGGSAIWSEPAHWCGAARVRARRRSSRPAASRSTTPTPISS